MKNASGTGARTIFHVAYRAARKQYRAAAGWHGASHTLRSITLALRDAASEAVGPLCTCSAQSDFYSTAAALAIMGDKAAWSGEQW